MNRIGSRRPDCVRTTVLQEEVSELPGRNMFVGAGCSVLYDKGCLFLKMGGQPCLTQGHITYRMYYT